MSKKSEYLKGCGRDTEFAIRRGTTQCEGCGATVRVYALNEKLLCPKCARR